MCRKAELVRLAVSSLDDDDRWRHTRRCNIGRRCGVLLRHGEDFMELTVACYDQQITHDTAFVLKLSTVCAAPTGQNRQLIIRS